MTFQTLCLAASAICASLFACLTFMPALVYWMFGIMGNPESDFMARRAAMLFLGFAVLCWKASTLEDAGSRRAVASAIAVSMAGLTIVSAGEFARGFAGPGILLAAAVEAVFAFLFYRIVQKPL